MEYSTIKAKHLIVISYDAFSNDNWEMARKLPNLSKLIENGVYSTNLKSIYPTLTYAVHSTMVTGVYTDKHGIYHNNPFQPFINPKDQNWFWFRKNIKVPTIYDAVKENGMKTASLLWPVTGKASINYNLPEIKAIKNENQALKILKNGTPFFCINMQLKYGSMLKGIEQPYLDDFTTKCAIDTIIKKKPNLLLMHLIELDDTKHKYGTDSKEIQEAIIRMDNRLGEIIGAVEKSGIMESTVFLIVGDHGQINVRYKVRLNQLFKEQGLIYEEDGELKWRAYLQSTGGSAYLHVRENDTGAKETALKIIKNAMKQECYGIESLYTRTELDAYHIDSSAYYMLEAKAGYSFDDTLDEEVIIDLEEQGIKYATHGYSPDKPEYKCNLVISGQCIKNEYELENAEMVDIAPTIADILGINFYNCDGKSLKEIFRD